MGYRADKAVELFEKGYNCSQAVFCAFADEFGFDEETAMRISIGFGGGFGRLREVCGAFSACTMLAGLADKSNLENAKLNKFQSHYETALLSAVICSDFQDLPKATCLKKEQNTIRKPVPVKKL